MKCENYLLGLGWNHHYCLLALTSQGITQGSIKNIKKFSNSLQRAVLLGVLLFLANLQAGVFLDSDSNRFQLLINMGGIDYAVVILLPAVIPLSSLSCSLYQ